MSGQMSDAALKAKKLAARAREVAMQPAGIIAAAFVALALLAAAIGFSLVGLPALAPAAVLRCGQFSDLSIAAQPEFAACGENIVVQGRCAAFTTTEITCSAFALYNNGDQTTDPALELTCNSESRCQSVGQACECVIDRQAEFNDPLLCKRTFGSDSRPAVFPCDDGIIRGGVSQ